MSIKPILFNTEMVRANLDGRKNTTRRLLKGYALEHLQIDTDGSLIGVYDNCEGCVRPVTDYAPYHPGDILYVRETWRVRNVCGDIARGDRMAEVEFKAGGDTICVPSFDYAPSYGAWKPSIHMPKEVARIFLRVKRVSVERLQDMTEDDALREGAFYHSEMRMSKYSADKFDGPTAVFWRTALDVFRYNIWDDTIPKKELPAFGWDANPWVWVIEYERCEKLVEVN